MKVINIEDVPWSSISHNPAVKKRVLLDDKALSGITTLSQAVFHPGDVASAHAHEDMAEVFMVTSGSGTIRLNDREYALNPDVVVVAEAHDTHEILNTGNEDLILTYFGVLMDASNDNVL
jgi:mannose-6-phosphate isomerase-like protein (cupin superfamily)